MGSSFINSGKRLDQLPILPFHRRLFALIGAGLFLDGFQLYFPSGLVSVLVKSRWAPESFAANYISAGLFGIMLGAWLSGIIGDRFGRQFCYQLNLLIFGLAAFGSAAAPSPEYLVLLRFVMGLGLGAEIIVGYALLIEYIPPNRRGRWTAGLALAISTAVFGSSFASYTLLPTIGWRWIFVGFGVASLLLWQLRKGIPESPRWLESKGRDAEAQSIISSIEREAAHRDVQSARQTATVAVLDARSSHQVLVAVDLRKRFVVGIAIHVGSNALAYAFFIWLPTFLEREGFSVTMALGFTAVISLGAPLGSLTGIVLSDRLSRRKTTAGLFFVLACLGLVFPIIRNPPLLLFIGLLLNILYFFLVSVTWASYLPELFPTRIRLRASGACNGTGRAVGVLLPFFVVPILNRFGLIGVTCLIGVLLAAAGIVVIVLGIETNDRSLEALGSHPTARFSESGTATLAQCDEG
jgi:MFS transporter, putative metabolite:H+ symporter